MRRRHLLAGAGIGSIGSLVGRLGSAGPSTDPGERTNPADGGSDDNGRNQTPPAVDDRPCPPYDTVRDRAVCSQTVDPDTAPVYLEPSADRRALADGRPTDEIELTLHNQSSRSITINPYGWTVRRHTGTEWVAFRQVYSITGHRTVGSSETASWTLTEAVESVRPDPELEPGLYAAELGVPDPTSDEWTACIALVRLEAPG